MVIALVILVLLTLIGIAISRTASIEILIAGNERTHKIAFYEAEAGVETAAELLELNIACSEGFTATASGAAVIENAAVVEPGSLAFWTNWSSNPNPPPPEDGSRDIYMPSAYAAGAPHTNINVAGSSIMSPGGAIVQSAGYEGAGHGTGGGGTLMLYNIIARHEGKNNSLATVMLQWRHVVGQEGSCLY